MLIVTLCECGILIGRFGSKNFADYVDDTVEKAIFILMSKDIKEASKQKVVKKKYLQRITSHNHFLLYSLIIVSMEVYDAVQFSRSTIYNLNNWFLFLPSVQLGCYLFILNIGGIPAIYFFKKLSLKHWIAVPLLTSVSLLILYHAIWIVILFAAYPTLVLTRALFLIPLYLPLIIIYRRVIYYFKKFLKLGQICKTRTCRSNPPITKFLEILCINITGIVFFVTSCSLVLGVLNYIAFYIFSEITQEPLQLMIIVAALSLVTFRIAKLFAKFKKDEDEQPENEDDQPENEDEPEEATRREHIESTP